MSNQHVDSCLNLEKLAKFSFFLVYYGFVCKWGSHVLTLSSYHPSTLYYYLAFKLLETNKKMWTVAVLLPLLHLLSCFYVGFPVLSQRSFISMIVHSEDIIFNCGTFASLPISLQATPWSLPCSVTLTIEYLKPVARMSFEGVLFYRKNVFQDIFCV